jgi:RNA polymerase sigma-70 factor (TIGR02943 family)
MSQGVSAEDAEDWVDKYSAQMYRFALTRVKDQDVAEEVVQEAFLAAWKSKSSFSGRSSEKSWLFGILKHKILDHFRQLKKRGEIEFGDPGEWESAESLFQSNGLWKTPPSSWGINPEQAAQNLQLLEALNKCVESLSDRFKSLFLLKEMDGLTADEICDQLEIKPANLWVMMHRIRNRLKTCLEANFEFSQGELSK